MKPFSGGLLLAVLSSASMPASALAQVPGFCLEYNDKDHDGSVYGVTGVVCPRDDCDDNNASIHPGATEICGDNIDQDCDGLDLPCPGADDDRDGFRASSAGGDDCDDNDASVHPGTPEICGDGKDNDCQGGDQTCATDADQDGYAAVASGGNDCNDDDPAIRPHAQEICGDGIDQDCAGGDAPCGQDVDGDGHLSVAMGGDDCDDFDRATSPGAVEVCGDGRDQDCNGTDLECGTRNDDADGDGHKSLSAQGDDCNDQEPTIYGGAPETCGDGIDQDCNGVDPSCQAADGDSDGDGFRSVEAGGDDCNDNDASIHPGAQEVCGDGRDQDCDGADAIPNEDAVCLGLATTNPAFAAIRDHQAPRETAGEPPSCCAVGRSTTISFLLLLLP